MTGAPYIGAVYATIDEQSLGALVRAFYGRVRGDPEIGPVFETAVEDWEAHFETLTAFWSSVMLATRRYGGRPMQAHMRQTASRIKLGGELFIPRFEVMARSKLGKFSSSGLLSHQDGVEPNI